MLARADPRVEFFLHANCRAFSQDHDVVLCELQLELLHLLLGQRHQEACSLRSVVEKAALIFSTDSPAFVCPLPDFLDLGEAILPQAAILPTHAKLTGWPR